MKKHIQSFFDQSTLTIVGSGLSVAEGISGMGKLAEKLIKDMPNRLDTNKQDKWTPIAEDLKNNIDLETALQRNEVCEELEKHIIEITYELISQEDYELFENLVVNKQELRFSKYLSQFNLNLYNLVVITTNYDLLIEYACEQAGQSYIDSFYGKIISDYSPSESLDEMVSSVENVRLPRNIYRKHIKLYKPHGSINWKLINSNIYRIQNVNFGTPCIITPGINKFERGYEVPFDYHIGKMGKEIDRSERIIFIGYGFNDNHLETHLENANNMNKPKLILTRSLTENAKNNINKNVMAIEYYKEENNEGSKVHWKDKTSKFEGINLWDIESLIGEVF